MTLVYGLCRDGEGVLIADTATIIPLTKQSQNPFLEPVLKVLTIGETVLGYAGDTSFLSGLLADAPREFPAFMERALKCHLSSHGKIDFIALKRDGREMNIVQAGEIRQCARGYIGSQLAFQAFRQRLPQNPPDNFFEELTAVRDAFREVVRAPTDGVAGLAISCTVGGAAVGYETSISHVWSWNDVRSLTVEEEGWQTLSLIDQYGGQFAAILTGLGYDGVCLGYPQIGVGFLFSASDPEPLVKMRIPEVSYRNLSRYDLGTMAAALDANAIQIGLPDSHDVARTLAIFLREETQSGFRAG